jgi:hypothetical protein
MFRQINARARYVGYDRSSEWRKYVDALGYPYRQKVIDTWSVETMEPADIAILSFFSDSGNLYYGSNSGLWSSLTEKFKLILVIDTSYDQYRVDAMLSRHGFRKITNNFHEGYSALWSKDSMVDSEMIWQGYC